MDRGYTQQIDTWTNELDYDASYMNSLVRILDSQVHGALEGIGAGIIDGGAVAADAGLSVSVSALKAVADTEHEKVYLQTDAPLLVADLDPSSTLYIHASALFLVAEGDDDSRETAVVELFASELDTASNAICLAEVVTDGTGVTAVTDLRTYVPAQEALATLTSLSDSIDDLQDSIDDLTTRVEALEAGGGGGGGASTWGALPRTGADPTTIPQYTAEELAEHVEDYHSGEDSGGGATINLEEWEVDAANMGQMVLALTRKLDQNLPDEFQDAMVVVHGVFGDGSGGTPDYVDNVNSTWV